MGSSSSESEHSTHRLSPHVRVIVRASQRDLDDFETAPFRASNAVRRPCAPRERDDELRAKIEHHGIAYRACGVALCRGYLPEGLELPDDDPPATCPCIGLTVDACRPAMDQQIERGVLIDRVERDIDAFCSDGELAPPGHESDT